MRQQKLSSYGNRSCQNRDEHRVKGRPGRVILLYWSSNNLLVTQHQMKGKNNLVLGKNGKQVDYDDIRFVMSNTLHE